MVCKGHSLGGSCIASLYVGIRNAQSRLRLSGGLHVVFASLSSMICRPNSLGECGGSVNDSLCTLHVHRAYGEAKRASVVGRL